MKSIVPLHRIFVMMGEQDAKKKVTDKNPKVEVATKGGGKTK